MTILAPRMLISLRREYYKAITGTAPGSLAQPIFRRHVLTERRGGEGTEKGKVTEKGKITEIIEVDEVLRTSHAGDVFTPDQSKILESDSIGLPLVNNTELDEPGVKIDNLF